MSGSNIVRDVTIRLNIQNGTAPPDFASHASGVKAFYSSVVTGSQEASTAIEGVGQSVEEMDSAVRHAVTELEMLIGSGANWDQLSDSVRRFSEMTADAMGSLNPDERAQAIEQTMANAREQYDQVSAAAETAGQRMSRSWASAANSMTQAISAGSRLVVSIGYLSGTQTEVDALVRKFSNVQVALQGLSAQGALFGNFAEGLQKIQVASTAAQTQLAILGANAGFATRAMAAIGPAAASAQAALAPISMVFAGISLAVVATQVAISAFSDASKNDMKTAEQAAAAYRKELEAVSQQMQSQTAEIELQRQLTMQLFEAKKLANGGAFTAQEVVDIRNQELQDAERQKQPKFEAAMAKAQSAIPEDVKARERELEAILMKKIGSIDKLKAIGVNTKGTEVGDRMEEERRSAAESLRQYRQSNALDAFGKIRQAGPDDAGAIERELKNLPESMSASALIMRQALVELAQTPTKIYQKSITDLEGLIREESQKVKAAGGDVIPKADGTYDVSFEDETMKAQKAFQKEREIAQGLMADPRKMTDFQMKIEQALSPLAALESIKGIITADEEQRLRGKADLNKADVRAARLDAGEFGTEEAELNAFIQEMTGKREEYLSAIRKLTDIIQEDREGMKTAVGEIEMLQRAQRQ